MKKSRKKAVVAVSRQKALFVVGADDDGDGFVTVSVNGPRGEFRYRVPVEPLQVTHGPVGDVAVAEVG